MADEQDQAEALDGDKLASDVGLSEDEAVEFPPDEPVAVDDPTQDDRVTDSFADRTLREDPDGVARQDPDGERVANLTLADLDRGAGPDEEKDLVGDAVGSEADPLANDQVPPAPEEAAIHIESQ